VTVKTSGTCGNAAITPGKPIDAWTSYQGNIYSAPVSFDVAQVLIDGQPISLAHWPSKAQTWAQAASTTSTSLSYALPQSDVVGATLIFRANDWAIEARKITGYSGGAMTVATTGNISFDGYALSGQPNFYLEGKLWMLDEPGEWAVANGRLYVWAPDGLSPSGRVFASPNTDAINAVNSKNLSLSGVTLYAAANGINALGATGLHVQSTNIVNSSENGILNSGGQGLYVDGSSILNSRHDAIAVKWGGGGEVVQNNRIDASGVIGMPTNAHSAINLTSTDGSQVSGNTVTHAGNIGIRVFRDAVVANNTVDTACAVLTDCGGIYVHAPDGLPLNTTITGNTISHVGAGLRLAWAIDLDNGASGVTVSGNTITASSNGMQIHDASGNMISGNRFSQSMQAHIQMDEDSASTVRNNTVDSNTFVSVNGEETYRVSSSLGASSVVQFASYSHNSYTSSSRVFANFNGQTLTYPQWQSQSGQDTTSTFQTP
jgi:parallel beta-helix repeat protein